MPSPKALVAAALLALSGCAGSGLPGTAPAPIATIQPGDDQLSCQQLTSQMAQMDGIVASASNGGSGALTNAATTAASSSVGGTSAFGQVLGNVASQAASDLSSNAAQEQQVEATQAQQRKTHLMGLYTQKKC